jgi:hypothetical protein
VQIARAVGCVVVATCSGELVANWALAVARETACQVPKALVIGGV